TRPADSGRPMKASIIVYGMANSTPCSAISARCRWSVHEASRKMYTLHSRVSAWTDSCERCRWATVRTRKRTGSAPALGRRYPGRVGDEQGEGGNRAAVLPALDDQEGAGQPGQDRDVEHGDVVRGGAPPEPDQRGDQQVDQPDQDHRSELQGHAHEV